MHVGWERGSPVDLLGHGELGALWGGRDDDIEIISYEDHALVTRIESDGSEPFPRLYLGGKRELVTSPDRQHLLVQGLEDAGP